MGLDRYLGSFITAAPTAPTQTSAQGVWELEQQASAQVQNAWPLPPNVIQRSLRFNSSDSAYLGRTPTTAGNQKTWTWSGWVKRSTLGTLQILFSAGPTSTNYTVIFFENDNLKFFRVIGGAYNTLMVTSAVFRDPSAWYHVVVSCDAANTTATIYVNGTAQSLSSNTQPSNANGVENSAVVHYIGALSYSLGSYLSGYASEINLVDGQALTPSSFGETDPQTGVWIPKVYTGSYGTNGFRLRFNNNSSTTALGYDSSGNGNNWTPNNFSVTAGSGNDSMLDVPSLYGTDTGLGGEVRGNYCTFSPITSSTSSLNGNLDVSAVSCAFGATMNFSSGKWYFEFTKNANGDNQLGIVTGTAISATGGGTLMFRRMWRDGSGSPSWVSDNATAGAGTPVSASVGDIISIALDLDNNAVYFAKNNVWMNGGIPTSGSAKSGAIWTDLGTYSNWGVYAGAASTGVYASLNAGQRPFAYTAPSGFKALCTTNLSASGTVTTSGTFTGNASTDGPFVYLNGIPTAMTINGNAVTFGTQADKLSNGFKVRSSSSSYNTSGSNTYSVSTTGAIFRYSNAQGNP